MKIKYFYTIYGEVEEKLQKRIPFGHYVYILNISGSDVCKIGYATYIFQRMNQIRRIIKSIFPFIENSITYNVYIFSPLKSAESKRKLESELHKVFKENSIDGEWFKCNFEIAINTLKEKKFNYINHTKLKNTLNLFDDDSYNTEMFLQKFNDMTHLKAFKELNFSEFIEVNYSELLNNNKYSYTHLKDSATKDDIINILTSFAKHIEVNSNKSKYKKDVLKRIENLIYEPNISHTSK